MAAERRVSLVLCSGTGERLGTLPTFTVDDPWWPEVQPVIETVRERFAVELVVLRLLDVVSDTYNGGDVTYLAELVGEPPRDLALTPAPAKVNEEQPLRASWARPGGVAATIAWADGALAAIDRPRTGPVVQIKTWNLSSILRLPTAEGDVWCKSVPPFLAHEGAIIALVGADEPTLVPPLLASDPRPEPYSWATFPATTTGRRPRLGSTRWSGCSCGCRLVDRSDRRAPPAGLPDWARPLPPRTRRGAALTIGGARRSSRP